VERDDVQRRIERLLDGMETGGRNPTIRARLEEREAQLATLEKEIAGLRGDLVRTSGSTISNRDRQRQLQAFRALEGEERTEARMAMHRIISGFVDQILVESTGEVTAILGHGVLNFKFAADMNSVRCIDLRGKVARGEIDERVFSSGPDGNEAAGPARRLGQFMG
jgi:hypothetical protein